MKNLILMRHAKSSWKNPDLDDFDRPLSKRGKRDAPLMGEHLSNQKIKPDLIISSPAKRAIKTARIIAEKIGYPKSKIVKSNAIYGAGLSALVALIHQLENRFENVIFLGHNPGITQLGIFLTKHPIENIPTCGIVGTVFNLHYWNEVSEGKGELVFFDYPKNINNSV